MDDTAIVGDNVEIVNASYGPSNSLSWSAVIAGAVVGLAVSFLIIALGAGIGLAVASPFGLGASATALTIAGAVWLVLAQAFGFAAGGFVAARMRRTTAPIRSDETRFRDGTHGVVAWAVGVLVMAIVLVGAVANSARTVALGGANDGAAGSNAVETAADPTAYFVDVLLRPDPSHEAAANSGQANMIPREQIARILGAAVRQGELSADDKTYLALVVAREAGISPEDARRRVDAVMQRALAAVDTTRKAAAYLSFWTFMSLLFGAVSGMLGGILGGERRDETASLRLSPGWAAS
jgi:hypothetical protein